MKTLVQPFPIAFLILVLSGCVPGEPRPTSIPIEMGLFPMCSDSLPACNQDSDAGNPTNCAVPVTVTGNCVFSTPAKDMKLIFRRSDQGRFIRWDLTDSPGFTFSGDGIFIPGNQGRQFDGFKLCPDGQRYIVRNRNTGQPGSYQYSIRLIN